MKEVITMHQCPMDMFPYTIEPSDTLQKIALRFNTSVNLISESNPDINSEDLKIGQVICIPSWFARHFYIQNISRNSGFNRQQVDLINEMRELWEEHIAWTRMAIISMVENLSDVDLVTKRLLRNPSDFAMVLSSLYGDKIASKFEELFKDHLVIASELVKAVKSGDDKAAEDAEKRWYDNADKLAKFLASINPYWTEDLWKDMLYKHLDQTKYQAASRIKKNYEDDIKIYDDIQNQVMKMADMMSEGIMRQFPNKF